MIKNEKDSIYFSTFHRLVRFTDNIRGYYKLIKLNSTVNTLMIILRKLTSHDKIDIPMFGL